MTRISQSSFIRFGPRANVDEQKRVVIFIELGFSHGLFRIDEAINNCLSGHEYMVRKSFGGVGEEYCTEFGSNL